MHCNELTVNLVNATRLTGSRGQMCQIYFEALGLALDPGTSQQVCSSGRRQWKLLEPKGR